VAAFILLGVAGLFLRGSKTGLRIANALVLLASIGLLERCYVLYATENGLIDGSCSMFLDFPTWFAVDQWLPSLFEVQGACGITPELLAGVSMAEGLLFTAVAVSLFSVLALALSLADPMHSEG
jgi:disulfide bond formation protein DsbB